jgi:hypothetical protein
LARAELQESLSVLIARSSRIELLDPHPAWVPFAASRRFEHLPIAISTK